MPCTFFPVSLRIDGTKWLTANLNNTEPLSNMAGRDAMQAQQQQHRHTDTFLFAFPFELYVKTYLISACLNQPTVCSFDKPQNPASHNCNGSQNPTSGFNFGAIVFKSAVVSDNCVLVEAGVVVDAGAKAAADATMVSASTDFIINLFY